MEIRDRTIRVPVNGDKKKARKMLLMNVGVMGIQYSHTKQVHNQVSTGDTKASFMNFSVNLLSIGLGVSFYL